MLGAPTGGDVRLRLRNHIQPRRWDVRPPREVLDRAMQSRRLIPRHLAGVMHDEHEAVREEIRAEVHLYAREQPEKGESSEADSSCLFLRRLVAEPLLNVRPERLARGREKTVTGDRPTEFSGTCEDDPGGHDEDDNADEQLGADPDASPNHRAEPDAQGRGGRSPPVHLA